eukprot:365162-Chlamydomonas_euryale.AAC.14
MQRHEHSLVMQCLWQSHMPHVKSSKNSTALFASQPHRQRHRWASVQQSQQNHQTEGLGWEASDREQHAETGNEERTTYKSTWEVLLRSLAVLNTGIPVPFVGPCKELPVTLELQI